MRIRPSKFLESLRVRDGQLGSDASFGNNGAFLLNYGEDQAGIIVSDGDGWDHASVSLQGRCPTWDEMCYVKQLFFRPDEWVMQFHPAKEKNINRHPNCLHLWRPQEVEIPKPPEWMV